MRVQINGEDYTSRSTAVAAQSNINLFAQKIEDPNETQKGPSASFGTPGRHTHCTLTGATKIYGQWAGAGRLFEIKGTNGASPMYLEEWDSAGGLVTSTSFAATCNDREIQIFANNDGTQLAWVAGTIGNGGYVWVANGVTIAKAAFSAYSGKVNTFDLVIGASTFYVCQWVSGNKFNADQSWTITPQSDIIINGVTYTISAVFPESVGSGNSVLIYLTSSAGTQTDVDYSHLGADVTATTITALDGYLIAQRPPTSGYDFGRQFNISGNNGSALNDFTSWNGLDFGRKESEPSNIIGIESSGGMLRLLGANGFEIWRNNGGGPTGTDFTFQRIDGATGDRGLVSPWAVKDADDKVYFLSSNEDGGAELLRLDGFQPVRVSNHAVENEWKGVNMRSSVAWVEQYEGHTFWMIQSMNGDTWGYDVGIGAWHKRYEWSGSAFTQYHTCRHNFIPEWGTAGKHITSGPLDTKVCESSLDFYDDAGTNRKWVRAMPHFFNDGKRMFFHRPELEMETGTVPSGAAPNVTLSYSKDRGKTFVNPKTASIGVNNDYIIRVVWPGTSSDRDRVYQLSGVGQYKVALVCFNMDVYMGTV